MNDGLQWKMGTWRQNSRKWNCEWNINIRMEITMHIYVSTTNRVDCDFGVAVLFFDRVLQVISELHFWFPVR